MFRGWQYTWATFFLSFAPGEQTIIDTLRVEEASFLNTIANGLHLFEEAVFVKKQFNFALQKVTQNIPFA